MADFEPFFELKNQYRESCPVLLQSGALYREESTVSAEAEEIETAEATLPAEQEEAASPRTFLRLAFRNIDPRDVTSVYVDIHIFDKATNELAVVRDRRYLVPIVGRDAVFGADEEIYVDDAAYSFSVAIKKVQFEGEDVFWNGSASLLFENLPEQAKIAQEAGACAVMALERVPADIRKAGGVARMADPNIVLRIMDAVTIPVMAKARIGHIVEARILESLGVDYIDESEVLTPADDRFHIDKRGFTVPFVCGARNLGEALRRIAEGATMIRTKGEPGTGDVVQAVRHMRRMNAEIRRIQNLRDDELFEAAKELQVPVELLREVHEAGKLPVVNFAAGGIATPADAALMMQLGAEGVFVGSGIFKSGDPARRAEAIVKATTNFNDPEMLAALSEDLGEAMVGINEQEIQIIMEERGQ